MIETFVIESEIQFALAMAAPWLRLVTYLVTDHNFISLSGVDAQYLYYL